MPIFNLACNLRDVPEKLDMVNDLNTLDNFLVDEDIATPEDAPDRPDFAGMRDVLTETGLVEWAAYTDRPPQERRGLPFWQAWFEKVQPIVSLAAGKMWESGGETGYYRDSYNISNLLWKYGLRYWTGGKVEEGGIGMNKEGMLSPRAAKKLMRFVQENEPDLSEIDNTTDLTDEEKRGWHKYFAEKRLRLISFLAKAVELKEYIRCSV